MGRYKETTLNNPVDDDLFDDDPEADVLWNSDVVRTLRTMIDELSDENRRLHGAVRLLTAASEVSA